MNNEQQKQITLPELPKPAMETWCGTSSEVNDEPMFTADQMCAYAIQAVMVALRAPVERQAPEGWREFLEQCAGFGGAMVSGNDLSRKASRLLFDAAPSADGQAEAKAGEQ